MKETQTFSAYPTPEEIAKRRDLRDIPTFTIDPIDAKDFDDALSIEYFDDGSCEIGVHIADVTHYVKPNTALDKEAYLRSTSVYLVDRVLPMLPERLSNELCSLRPNEDKYTFSAVFKFDKKDNLIGRWFGKTIIHSDRRFAYEEAQEVIENKEGDMTKEILDMARIARKMRKQRFKEGAIAFESEEVRFKLDEDGVPIDVYIKERKEANLLIEDYMLLANKEVAIYVNKKEKPEIPYIYRIHDLPNPDKVAEFARFAFELGVHLKTDTPEQIAKSYNDLAKKAQTEEALKMLQPLAIRTMAKAEYATDNIGHYGLGFDFYTHFTSPIRRYSDVLAHRILYQVLENKNYRFNKETLDTQCRHISLMERKANDAERESIKYKQTEFMEKHVGSAFEGVISGIIDRGIFVELKESHCEGMVSFDTMYEAFEITDGRLKAVGLRTGKVYKMGDTVRVVITNADLQKRQIDMRMEED
jgi:ribonuclease R